MPLQAHVEPVPVVILGGNRGREAHIATEELTFRLPDQLWIPLSEAAKREGLAYWFFRRERRVIAEFRLLATFFPAKGRKIDGTVHDVLAELASRHLTAPLPAVKVFL